MPPKGNEKNGDEIAEYSLRIKSADLKITGDSWS
jgi:hypothetical protein